MSHTFDGEAIVDDSQFAIAPIDCSSISACWQNV